MPSSVARAHSIRTTAQGGRSGRVGFERGRMITRTSALPVGHTKRTIRFAAPGNGNRSAPGGERRERRRVREARKWPSQAAAGTVLSRAVEPPCKPLGVAGWLAAGNLRFRALRTSRTSAAGAQRLGCLRPLPAGDFQRRLRHGLARPLELFGGRPLSPSGTRPQAHRRGGRAGDAGTQGGTHDRAARAEFVPRRDVPAA